MDNIRKLIAKYETSAPRYTSYPTAPHFSVDTDKSNLERLAIQTFSNYSLYIHIPFCENLCWFCGCTSSVCKDHTLVDKYIDLLKKELRLWQDKGLPRNQLKQIHFGGGTPNFLSPKQILRVGEVISDNFKISDDCEFSVELDPRTLTKDKVDAFVNIGLNRASMGIQDTNIQVQKAINRIQPQEKNLEAVKWLRDSGVNDINTDLIYGLPLQNLETCKKTLMDTMQLEPTRISLFSYAHVPWIKQAQKILEKNTLPTSNEKLEIFLKAKDFLEAQGYEYVGFDHFAKPCDPLMQARKNGTLRRNFQGYTTHSGLDNFAIGLTSISETKTSYRQNYKNMQEYSHSIENGILPIERGIVLNSEDILRRAIIMDIMCNLKVTYNNYGVDFKEKFADVFPKLNDMQNDGLIQIHNDYFEVTDLGRLFLRNIALLFDGRISISANQKYSKTV